MRQMVQRDREKTANICKNMLVQARQAVEQLDVQVRKRGDDAPMGGVLRCVDGGLAVVSTEEKDMMASGSSVSSDTWNKARLS